MKYLTAYLAISFLVAGCGMKSGDQPASTGQHSPAADTTYANRPSLTLMARDSIAHIFLRDYLLVLKKQGSDTAWVQANEFVTDEFKTAHRELIRKAWKEEPEYGLGFDPILDAQDYPEEFIVALSSADDFVTLSGKDWPEFNVVIKMKKMGISWKVDGAGVVNIPEDKRANRN